MTRSKSQRREDLLQASIEYMLKNGVADLSLRPLAAEVGSKARLLIYHFGSKDGLITDAMLIIRERVKENFAALMGSRRDRKPSEIVRSFWAWATSQPNEPYLRLFFEVHGLALQNPKQYGRYLKGAFTTWVELMAGVLPATLSRAERRALASLAVGSVVGLMLDFLSSGDKKRTSGAVDQFAKGFDSLLHTMTRNTGARRGLRLSN